LQCCDDLCNICLTHEAILASDGDVKIRRGSAAAAWSVDAQANKRSSKRKAGRCCFALPRWSGIRQQLNEPHLPAICSCHKPPVASTPEAATVALKTTVAAMAVAAAAAAAFLGRMSSRQRPPWQVVENNTHHKAAASHGV
jgi:hypothetical protein